VVCSESMQSAQKQVRQSVSLPSEVARQVKLLARKRRASASRVIGELVESGLDAQERERQRFFELADRLASSKDPSELKRLKEELARMTFGA
jgi:predicted transcriptional regulator